MHTSLLGHSVAALPQGSDSLQLSVEVDSRASVESAGTATGNRLLVTGEREHGQRDGDGHIDTNLSGLNVATEGLGRRSRLGEDGDSVTVLVLVNQLNGVINGLDVQANQDGTEDLLRVAGHFGGDVGDDGGTDKVAVGVLLVLVVAAVKEDGSSLLLGSVNDAQDALLALRRDDGSKIGTLLKSTTDLELLSALGNFRQPLLGLANHDKSAQSHASLASSAKSSTDDAVDEVVLVAVGKDGGVVLGAQVGLDTLAIGRTASEDVFTGLVSTDERDGLDGGLVQDEVDSAVSSVDDVDDTLGEASLLNKLSEDDGSARVTLGRLEDQGVTSNGSNGNTPERNHSREVWVSCQPAFSDSGFINWQTY